MGDALLPFRSLLCVVVFRFIWITNSGLTFAIIYRMLPVTGCQFVVVVVDTRNYNTYSINIKVIVVVIIIIIIIINVLDYH